MLKPKYAADIKTRMTNAMTSAAINAMLSINLNIKLTHIPEKPPSKMIRIGSKENMSWNMFDDEFSSFTESTEIKFTIIPNKYNSAFRYQNPFSRRLYTYSQSTFVSAVPVFVFFKREYLLCLKYDFFF